MAELGQAFLHASLLGTEAEASRLREIKAEYFRQKQQRAAGDIGHFSFSRNMHMSHGLQHRRGSSSRHLLQLSRPGLHHCRHMLHGLQHRLGSSSGRLLQDTMAAQASLVIGDAARIAVWVRLSAVQSSVTPFQDSHMLLGSTAALDGRRSRCSLLSSQAVTHSALMCPLLQARQMGARQMGARPMGVRLPLMQLQQALRGPAQQLRVGSSGTTAPRCSRPSPRARGPWATAPPAMWWPGWWTRPPAA